MKSIVEFKAWECDEAKRKRIAAGEVTGTVFDRYRDATYLEASYKPYIIAAMILLCKRKNPASTLMVLGIFAAGFVIMHYFH